MQETEKINEYGFSPRFTETVRDVKNNILMIGMALLILAGMAFGAFLARDPDCLSYQGVSFIIKEYAVQRGELTFWQNFVSSLEGIFPFFLSLFFGGLFLLGAVCIPFIMFFRGLGLGLVMGYLYGTFGWEGVGYSVCLLLPYCFLTSVALLFVAREGIRFSFRMAGQMLPSGKPASLWPAFRLFCVRSLMLAVLILIASFLDSVLVTLCHGLFSLS